MNWYKISQDNTAPLLWFYHGASTGATDEFLQSFLTNGIQPDRATGFGQGSGFYTWLSKKAAMNHAVEIEQPGVPMIVKFQSALTPENFDFDYEVQLGQSAQMILSLWNELKKIPDGQIQSKKKEYTGEGWKTTDMAFSILPSKCKMQPNSKAYIMDIVYKLEDGKEKKVRLWSDNDDTGNLFDAPVYAAVINYFEQNTTLVHDLEKQMFGHIVQEIQQNGEQNYCIKYDGQPLPVNAQSNIEVLFQGKWIDGQTYLDSQKEAQSQPVTPEQPVAPTTPEQPTPDPKQQLQPQAVGTSWYKFAERDHDYNPEWDYPRDPSPNRQVVKAFEQAANNLRGRLSIFDNIFENFTLYYTSDSLTGKGLAVYIDGTYDEPVIVVSSANVLAGFRDINSDFPKNSVGHISLSEIAYTTLLHELKHAVQDSDTCGEYDEDEAEEFARNN